MKILIYVWSLCNGGAERVASLWAQGFAQKGYDVNVMLASFQKGNDYEMQDNVKIVRQSFLYDLLQKILPSKVKEKFFSSRYCDYIYNALPEFVKNWFTSKVLKQISPDVIIVVLPGLFNRIHGALKKINVKIPIIVTDHNSYERPESAPFSKVEYNRKFTECEKYDYLTVLTAADRKILEMKLGESFMKKVSVLPNPLTFKPVKCNPLKEKVILAAGRLNMWHCKGFDILLKAWSEIYTKFPDWKLKIAGRGNNSYLLKLCDELGIKNNVEFLGFVNLEDEYKKAEIFVLSSRYEGFGMVLTEAMSQGCACIACDYKGRQSEIISCKEEGLLCPPDDIDALKNAICTVVTDENYRHTMQKKAVERSKYYELPNIINHWEKIFHKIGLNGV